MKIDDELKEFYEPETKTKNLVDKTKQFTESASSKAKQLSFIIVGSVLAIAVILLNFVGVDFDPFIKLREFATNTILLIICTYWFMINFGDYGKQVGYASDKYKKALAAHIEIKERLQASKKILRLTEYCAGWTKEKMVRDRQSALFEVGMEYEDYLSKGYNKMSHKELEGTELTKMEQIAVVNANAVRPIVLEPDKLINIKRNKIRIKLRKNDSATGEEPTKKIAWVRGKTLVSIIANSTLAGGIVVSTAIEGSLGAIALCIFKIAIMAVFAFRGYLKHYAIIADELSDYMTMLVEYLKEFEKWCEQKGE